MRRAAARSRARACLRAIPSAVLQIPCARIITLSVGSTRQKAVKGGISARTATCADTEKSAALTTLDCFRGYADCEQGAEECGVIYGTGVYEKGKIEGAPAYDQAYEMGRKV